MHLFDWPTFLLPDAPGGAKVEFTLYPFVMRERSLLESVTLLEISEGYLRQSVEALQAGHP